jgi:hypothetical protein
MVEFCPTLGSDWWDTLLLQAHCLLYLFTSSWYNSGRSHASRNLSIPSRFSSVLECKFSEYSLKILWMSLGFIKISPFLSLILLFWAFSLFLSVSLDKGLSILFFQLFVSLILCIFFFKSPFYQFLSWPLLLLPPIIPTNLEIWGLACCFFFFGFWYWGLNSGLHSC